MMYELIYCSVADDNINDKNITDILKTARSFNIDNQITGCLVYYQGQFIQVLEGEKQVVQELFERIKKDDRHSQVLLLADGEMENRSFNNWSMAFYELKNDVAKEIDKEIFFSNFIAFSALAQRPSTVMDLFWEMTKDLLETT